jgi:hypothetical protein
MSNGLVNAFVMLVAGGALAACTTAPQCEELSKCGGDFLMGAKDLEGVDAIEWVATAPGACVDQVPTPPNPGSLLLIPPRPAGVRAVEPTTVDWCNGLVLASDGAIRAYDDGWEQVLKQFGGWFPSVPLYTAQLEIQRGYQYSISTTQLVTQHAELSGTCLVGQGVKLTCGDLNAQLATFIENKFNAIAGLKADVYDNTCADGPDAGCSCDYNVSLTSTTAGPWGSETGQIAFFDFNAAPPARADYCVSGAGLSLSGEKGGDLFNRGSLKTLKLAAPTCSDGVQSKSLGETGIDCGGSCPNACP